MLNKFLVFPHDDLGAFLGNNKYQNISNLFLDFFSVSLLYFFNYKSNITLWKEKFKLFMVTLY